MSRRFARDLALACKVAAPVRRAVDYWCDGIRSQEDIDAALAPIIGPIDPEKETLLKGCSIVIAGYSFRMAKKSGLVCEVEECEIIIRMRSHFVMIGCPTALARPATTAAHTTHVNSA
jgi:hypothetical protein